VTLALQRRRRPAHFRAAGREQPRVLGLDVVDVEGEVTEALAALVVRVFAQL